MSEAEQNRIIDEWEAERNKHIGEITIPKLGEWPVKLDNFYRSQLNEWVTTDLIRHYAEAVGDRNPLWRSHDYAKRTTWGGIIAPPTICDSIGHHAPVKFEPEQWGKFNSFIMYPVGEKYDLFQVIRPGDRFRLFDRYLGLKELKTKQPKPCRQFFNTVRTWFINQREETVAVVDYIWDMYVNRPEGSPSSPYEGYGRKPRRLTDEERDAIYRGYDEEKRRGADTLYWEDVVVGEEVKPLVVGPYSTYDTAAIYTAISGHAVGFDIEWDRIKCNFDFACNDNEINAWKCGGECHFCDGAGHAPIYTGGKAYAITPSLHGLRCRAICNWMGDDGFLKRLDNWVRVLTLLGDVFKTKGRVTNKYTEGDEYLVDLEVNSENQDGIILMTGSATVRLPSRTKF